MSSTTIRGWENDAHAGHPAEAPWGVNGRQCCHGSEQANVNGDFYKTQQGCPHYRCQDALTYVVTSDETLPSGAQAMILTLSYSAYSH